MADIRLKKDRLKIGGKTYVLRCNMNVLADVQEIFGGYLTEALNPQHRHRSALEFCAAMLNDYADEKGWDERWTARKVGREIVTGTPGDFTAKIMDLVWDSLGIDNSTETAEDAAQEEEDGKKKQTGTGTA